MMLVLGIIIGMLIGAPIGLITSALCFASGRSDEFKDYENQDYGDWE